MTDLEDLQNRYREFVEARDWDQFHIPKNVAMAISVEANELLELFLWHGSVSSDRVREDDELMAAVEDEIADVLIYAMSLAIQLDIDLVNVVEEKLTENEARFDAETAAEITTRLQNWQDEPPSSG